MTNLKEKLLEKYRTCGDEGSLERKELWTNGMRYRGFAGANIEEPSPGDLERVLKHYHECWMERELLLTELKAERLRTQRLEAALREIEDKGCPVDHAIARQALSGAAE